MGLNDDNVGDGEDEGGDDSEDSSEQFLAIRVYHIC